MSISAFDPTVGYKSASCISTINTKFDADGNTVESRSSTMGETSLSFDCSSLVPANSTIHWSWFYCGSVTVSGIYTTGKLWIHNTLIDTSGGELDLDNALSATVKLWFQAKNSVAGGPYTPTYAQTATFNNCYMEVYYTPPGKCSAPTSVTVSPTSVGPNGAATLSWGASSGGHNNAVTGYYVSIYNYQTGTEYELGRTNAVARSYPVTAPTGNGQKYKYRVYALPTLAGYASDWSAWSADLVCSFSAPSVSDVTLDNSSSAIYVVAGSNVTLRWIGANGTNNAITSYNIYQNGVIYKTGQGGSSLVVPSHSSSGSSYYYTVLPIAPHGNGAGVNSPTVYSYVPCSAPTTVSVASNNVRPNTDITLSWLGAGGGGAYNVISNYELWRSTSPTSGYTKVQDVAGTGTGGSVAVRSHDDNDSTYYYKILTVGSRLSSNQSSAYATLKTTFTAPSVSNVTLSKQYVAPGGESILNWNAANGTNNNVISYTIYRDGTVFKTGVTGTTYIVAGHATAGSNYQYSVKPIGEFLDGATVNAPVLYSYGAMSAPSIVTIDNAVIDGGTTSILSWEGAVKGALNDIIGFIIYHCATENGTYTVLKTVAGTATSGSTPVTANSTMGTSVWYKIATIGTYSTSGQSSAKASLTTKNYTIVKAPTTVSVSPLVVDAGTNANLVWEGAEPGTNNPITGYKIYRSESPDSGYTLLHTLGLVTTYPVTAHSSLGNSYYYKVEAIGTKAGFINSGMSAVYATLKSTAYTGVTSPTSVAITAAIMNPGAEVVFSWSGAIPGIQVAIAGYEVWRSVNGATYIKFGLTVPAGTLNVVDTIGTSGVTYAYKVKTIADRPGYDSGFSNIKTVKSNTAPTAPASLAVSPALYEAGIITLTFPASSDTDGNLSHYQVQRRIQSISSGWGSWTNLNTNLQSLSMTDSPIVDRGARVQYQVKAHDALGLYSDYAQSIQIIRNSVPLAPVESYPTNDKNTYNSNPYFRVYAPPEPDGTGQTLQMAIDAGEYSNVSSIPSGGSNIRARAGASLGVGSHTIKFRAVDITGGVGPALTLSVNILSVDYARELTVGKVIAKKGSHFAEDIFVSVDGAYNGQNAEFVAGHSFSGDVFEVTGNAGISHQTEILQLYQQVNNVRAYYNLSPIAIPELVGDHANPGTGKIGMFAAWGSQMMAIRNALAETWPVNGISAITWIACTSGMYPLASVINQIRDRIRAG